jgi:hypothetical protein
VEAQAGYGEEELTSAVGIGAGQLEAADQIGTQGEQEK